MLTERYSDWLTVPALNKVLKGTRKHRPAVSRHSSKARSTPRLIAAEQLQCIRDRAARDYAEINKLEWRKFCARGLHKAWEFLHGQPCIPPDLSCHPADLILFLGLRPSHTNELICELEDRVRAKIERIEEDERLKAIALRRAQTAGRERSSLLILAYPSWANRDAIKAIYQECRLLNLQHGPRSFHVDHIVPLKGRTVCGLHVENNLRVIPARENISKNNKFIEA